MMPASSGNADSMSTWWRRRSTMWSTCSMSTGHCSTHAPQVVHDHSMSNGTTPAPLTPCSSTAAVSSPLGPTSGRCASAIAASGMPSGSPSRPWVASRYGALASAWSRRLMMSSLGESGLPVFHAGHWLWQRPHSVHVPKSSSPFQVKSSTFPTPMRSSSPGSSKSTGLPPE